MDEWLWISVWMCTVFSETSLWCYTMARTQWYYLGSVIDPRLCRQPDQGWSDPGLCPSSNPRSALINQSHLDTFSAASVVVWMALLRLSPVILSAVYALQSPDTRPSRTKTWLSNFFFGSCSLIPHTLLFSIQRPPPSVLPMVSSSIRMFFNESDHSTAQYHAAV